jgi:hypothetical protein
VEVHPRLDAGAARRRPVLRAVGHPLDQREPEPGTEVDRDHDVAGALAVAERVQDRVGHGLGGREEHRGRRRVKTPAAEAYGVTWWKLSSPASDLGRALRSRHKR